MKAELHVPMTVQEAVEKIRLYLKNDKFIFSEEDARYIVKYPNKKSIKTKDMSRFWSKRELGDKYPETYSLTMEGTLKAEEEGTIIDLEIIEYHHGREHTYGGTRAIEEYFNKFCEIFVYSEK